MKTPSHWKNKNLCALALLPLGCVYAGMTALRLKLKKPTKVNVPVICIGNLTAGGSGKTPTAVSIAKIVKSLGKKPFFVSRGYGGKLSGVIVDEQKHTPQQVGDEPLLLAREAGVSINADRAKAAQNAIANGAEVIVMDDGFQNPTLHKDLSFLVFDGAVGIGNGYPVPAGPLREFFDAGLKRADAAIIIGEDKCGLHDKLKNLPILEGRICSLPLSGLKPKVIAFAGIGRPEKFYNSLRECGANVVQTFDFPDHHYYTQKELEDLMALAKKIDADLVTTAKDFVKIPNNLKPNFKVLEIEIRWKDEKALKEFLAKL